MGDLFYLKISINYLNTLKIEIKYITSKLILLHLVDYECNTDYCNIIFGRTNNSIITYYLLCLGFVTNMLYEIKIINIMA